MATAKRRGRIGIVAFSAAAHGALLALLALHAPQLVTPDEDAGPPLPVIPVILAPAPPPTTGQSRPPEPIRLHRRQLRNAPPIPVAPLPLPDAPAPRSDATPAPRFERHPAPMPESPRADFRAALRKGPTGCANPDAVGLSRTEREACAERLGDQARIPAFRGPAIDPEKAAAFDAAVRRKEAYRQYRDQPPVRGTGFSREGADQSSRPKDLDPLR
jgi:hypothetical protein